MFLKAILLFSFVGTFAHAADDGVMAQARAAVDKASAAISNYQKAAGSYYDRWFAGRMDAGFSRIDAAVAGMTGNKDDFETATNYRAQLAKTREEDGKKAKAALEAANAAVSQAVDSTGNAISKATTNTVDAAQYGNLIRQINDGSKLTWDVNKLWGRYADVNETMRVVEQQLDKSVLNAYIQQKAARLLSSDNLCTAAKSCNDNKGKNKATFSMADMKDIFPNSSAEIVKLTAQNLATQAQPLLKQVSNLQSFQTSSEVWASFPFDSLVSISKSR